MALHVAVAAVFDAAGRVLLARRPAHVHQGDLWEFPGGKLEPGEEVEAALARELWEEIHIRPTHSRPLIRIPFRYPDREVLLDVWRVDGYSGTPSGREGQALAWAAPEALDDYPLPAANRPIVSAVQLPDRYAISGGVGAEPRAFLDRLQRTLERGERLIQLRPLLDAASPGFAALMREAIAGAHAAGARVLLNAAPEQALRLGADGVHLNGSRLRACNGRPLPAGFLVAASCHGAAELAQAVRSGADFAVLSPVQPTASHPDAQPLGWSQFAALAAAAPLPVYALGGVGPADIERAQWAGGQGVAGIGAFWG